MYTRARQGAVDIISGDEPLDLDHCAEVSQLVGDCLVRGQPRVVFDLRGVPFIDSAGLELLLDVLDQCCDAGGLCKLAGPNPLCNDILEATMVGAEFEIFPDAVEAAASFAL